MLFGEEPHVMDRAYDAATLTTPIALEAAAGAIYTRKMTIPGKAGAFVFKPTVLLNYDTQTAKGVLTLYKYPVAAGTDKVVLGTINLEDGDLAEYEYLSRISDKPADTSPAPSPDADYAAGDLLVVEITTQAEGGGGIAGDFQPFIIVQNRGENTPNQSKLVDRTPA